MISFILEELNVSTPSFDLLNLVLIHAGFTKS